MQGRHYGKSYDCYSIHIQCAKVTAASGHISSTFFVLASNSVNIVAITLLVLLVGTIMFLAIRPYVLALATRSGSVAGQQGCSYRRSQRAEWNSRMYGELHQKVLQNHV